MTGIYLGDLSIFTTEELEAELLKRKKPKAPKFIKNPDYTKLKSLCIEYVEGLSKSSIDKKVDEEHYIFETAIESFYGKDVWNYINHEYWEEKD